MRQIVKRTLLLLLCSMIIFCAVSASRPLDSFEKAEARTLFDIEDDIAECKALLATLQKELKAITASIADLEGKSGETAALLAQYQAEIDALEAEILIEQSIKDSYDIKRADLLAQKALITEDYEYRVSMYKKMMQFIYENSNINSFELLFSSDSLAEYLTRRDNFNDIMDTASRLLKEIEVSLADLEVYDRQLMETQALYDEHLKELSRKESEMKIKIEEFETIASDLNLNSEELTQQYKDKNTNISNVKAQLKKLEEERKKIISSNKSFIWPVKTSNYRVTSQYGWRGDPFGKPSTEYHKGIDIACAKGTPILAVKDGIVTRASENYGYGHCVIIYHGNGISSLYAHCDNTGRSGRPIYEVKVGDSVKAGQVIAYVGTTGRSTGDHLHFGVIDTNTYTSLGGNYVNPNKYLPDGYYTKKS